MAYFMFQNYCSTLDCCNLIYMSIYVMKTKVIHQNSSYTDPVKHKASFGVSTVLYVYNKKSLLQWMNGFSQYNMLQMLFVVDIWNHFYCGLSKQRTPCWIEICIVWYFRRSKSQWETNHCVSFFDPTPEIVKCLFCKTKTTDLVWWLWINFTDILRCIHVFYVIIT